VAAAVLGATVAGCGADGPATDTAAAQSGASSCINRVTPDCGAYTYSSPRPGTVVVSASRSSAINNREFFWSRSGPVGADQSVCATFVNGRGFDQQGIVLRLTRLAGNRVTGITVTRNVWMGAFDVFNFHVWDTRAGSDSAFLMFGSTIVPTLPIAPAVYPLHLCARTVTTTNVVQFVAWTPGQARPDWGSSASGGQATIPVGAPSSGHGGWFAGHLKPGTSMTYTDLSADGAVAHDLP
jgi:hypothetical protein